MYGKSFITFILVGFSISIVIGQKSGKAEFEADTTCDFCNLCCFPDEETDNNRLLYTNEYAIGLDGEKVYEAERKLFPNYDVNEHMDLIRRLQEQPCQCPTGVGTDCFFVDSASKCPACNPTDKSGKTTTTTNNKVKQI